MTAGVKLVGGAADGHGSGGHLAAAIEVVLIATDGAPAGDGLARGGVRVVPVISRLDPASNSNTTGVKL